MSRKAKKTSTSNPSNKRLRQIILDSEHTNGDVYLVKGIMPKGSVVPNHIHELEDEIFHVLKGEVELTLGDKTIEAKKNAVIYLPRGIKHGIKTIGDETAEVLNYAIPGKNFEAFFAKMNDIGLNASIEEKQRIAKAHKITFL